jgi:hypothetical protein
MIDNTNLQNPIATDMNAVQTQSPINPRIKPSGAPVAFSPKSQNTIMSAFGNPVANSYDRTMDGPVPIPQPIIDSNVPTSNFYNT